MSSWLEVFLLLFRLLCLATYTMLKASTVSFLLVLLHRLQVVSELELIVPLPWLFLVLLKLKRENSILDILKLLMESACSLVLYWELFCTVLEVIQCHSLPFHSYTWVFTHTFTIASTNPNNSLRDKITNQLLLLPCQSKTLNLVLSLKNQDLYSDFLLKCSWWCQSSSSHQILQSIFIFMVTLRRWSAVLMVFQPSCMLLLAHSCT